MFIFTYSAAILAILNLGFAAFIIIKKIEEPLARYLALLMTASSIWLLGNALTDVSYTPAATIFWAGTALIGGLFTMTFYLCFIELFVNKKITKIKYAIFFIPVILMSLLAYSKYSVYDTTFPFDQPAQTWTGGLYWGVLVYVLFTWIYSFTIVMRMRQRAKQLQRIQISYIFFGFAFQFAGAMACNIILPLTGNISFFTLGPQFIIFLTTALAYVILRHHLLRIKFIIQRSIIYSVLITLVVATFIVLASIIPEFFNLKNSTAYFIASLASALIGSFGVPPIKKFLQKQTDRVFYKDRVPYADAVHSLISAMSVNLDLDALLKSTMNELGEIFKPAYIKIYLTRDKLLFERGAEQRRANKIIENADFEILPDEDGAMFINADYDGVTVAQILIGEKKSDDAYLPEDREILDVFSYQFAIALQKTYLYEQRKQRGGKTNKRKN